MGGVQRRLPKSRDPLLEPGGTLRIDIEVPYADPYHWEYWLRKKRTSLPEAAESPQGRRRASDGAGYALTARLIAVEPSDQRVTMASNVERWRDGVLDAEEERLLHIGMDFKNEMLLMLERASFTDVVVHGEHEVRPPTSDDDFVVSVARV